MASLRHKDLLGIEQLSVEDIGLILDTAEALREVAARPVKKVPPLRGKTVVNLAIEVIIHTVADLGAGNRLAIRIIVIGQAIAVVVKAIGAAIADA